MGHNIFHPSHDPNWGFNMAANTLRINEICNEVETWYEVIVLYDLVNITWNASFRWGNDRGA
mgnify:CR=1 FL=1